MIASPAQAHAATCRRSSRLSSTAVLRTAVALIAVVAIVADFKMPSPSTYVRPPSSSLQYNLERARLVSIGVCTRSTSGFNSVPVRSTRYASVCFCLLLLQKLDTLLCFSNALKLLRSVLVRVVQPQYLNRRSWGQVERRAIGSSWLNCPSIRPVASHAY